MKEEKTYTFRHFRQIFGLDVSEDDLKNTLVESELARGYYPIHIKTHKRRANALTIATCHSAYAGKKTARVLWEKNPFLETPVSVKTVL